MNKLQILNNYEIEEVIKDICIAHNISLKHLESLKEKLCEVFSNVIYDTAFSEGRQEGYSQHKTDLDEEYGFGMGEEYEEGYEDGYAEGYENGSNEKLGNKNCDSINNLKKKFYGELTNE